METEKNDVLVSIDCITYNQEKYIAQAIESFLMQETDFAFEILIHDDCSTDNTVPIVKAYEKKYPNIIKVIYEKENQYSKGRQVSEINCANARGKYIAVCEGDDYWTSPYKLQKQVDFMEKHPEYSLCTHATKRVNELGEDLKRDVRPNIGNKEFTIEEMLPKDGSLFATNSMLYRRNIREQLPDFYYNAPIGDYPLTIALALKGKVFYMDEAMSAYRIGAQGSWSEKMGQDINYYILQKKRVIKMLEEINEYTNYNYEKIIYERKCLFVDDRARELAMKLPINKRIKYILDCKEIRFKNKIRYWGILLLYNHYVKLWLLVKGRSSN